MGIKLKIANFLFFLTLAGLCSARVIAYEVKTLPAQAGTGTLETTGANDLFKNSQSEVNRVLKGLTVPIKTGSTSVNGIFNFKNFSTSDISGIIKSVFGLAYKVMAVIVTVTIDALKGILGSISSPSK